MESKKINQLATELSPVLSDLTIIGDPTTGISKKITLSQMASLFTGTVEEYPNLASFPLVGVADTIYIALDTNVLYRWNTGTNAYVELSPNIINSLVFSDANGFDGNISLVGSTATLTITTALTQGSVPFIGTSGALTQDNANLFFDDTNNRLGINTNAPTTALDVFGSGIIGRLNGTSTNNSFLGFASAGTNKWSIGNVQSDHRFRIYNEAATSELFTILPTGEIGIGIANPFANLHIDGGASVNRVIMDANINVAKIFSFRSDNSPRWAFRVDGTESGSNAGADFAIRRYTDAGAFIDAPLSIVRSTGVTTIKSLTLTNALSVANGGTGVTSLGNIASNDTSSMTISGGTGAIIGSGVTITLLNASATNGGIVSTGTQTFAGAKSFLDSVTITANTGNSPLRFTSTTASSKTGYLYADASIIGITDTLNAGAALGGIFFNSTTKETLLFNNGNVSLTLASNGAATFASSVSTTELKLNNISALIHVSSYNVIRDTDANNSIILGNSSTPQNFYNNTEHIFRNRAGTTSYLNITSGGNVGIGTTTPDSYPYAGKLNVNGNISTSGGKIGYGVSDAFTYFGYSVAHYGMSYSFSTNPLSLSGYYGLSFFSFGEERMRITSGGNVLIGTTSDTYGSRLSSLLNDNGYSITAIKQATFGAAILARVDNTNSDYVRFFYSASNTQTGSINTNGTTTSYNVTSDYRLKQDLKDYKGLDLISSIKTYDYQWKSDKSRMYGVMAHELQDIIPYAVQGKKDEIDENGKEKMQSVDYSKIVPILVKAIQELKAEIEILKNK
jgi:hypothetical protein